MSLSSNEPQPAQPTGTYTVEQTQALNAQAMSATGPHLIAAADKITDVFQTNNISYALMGGFSLRIRGSSRETHDVDIAVGCDMLRLITVLAGQADILRPLGPVSGVVRIFTKVGGVLDPSLNEIHVMVDLILRGSLGAPDHPENELEIVSMQTSGGARQYKLLNLCAITTAKLGAAFSRSALNDAEDLVFLIQKYPEDLWGMRAKFEQEHRQHFVNMLHVEASFDKKTITKAQLVLGIAGYTK